VGNNNKMHFQKVRYGDMDWMELALDRYRFRELVNGVMNVLVSQNARNFLTSCKPVSL
jgi:hypothetical protein